MNGLQEYLLEKLHLTSGVEHTDKAYDGKVNSVSIDVGKLSKQFYLSQGENSKVKINFQLPASRYMVYRDKYHHNKYHVDTAVNMICAILMCFDDYEGFSLRDIVYSTNSLDELKKYLEDNYNERTWYDNKDFIDDLLKDEDKFLDDLGPITSTAEMIKKIKQSSNV